MDRAGLRGYVQLSKYTHMQGDPQEDTMESSLRREILGRSLGSHDPIEPVGGTCHGNGCRKETTRLHATSSTKTGWVSLRKIECPTRL